MSLSRVCLLTVLVCANAVVAFGQKNKAEETFFAYDKDWKPVNDIARATYFSRAKKISDTCWIMNNYNVVGPMISKEVYKDRQEKIAHGTWIFYKPTGYMDSICTFRDNLAHGSWYFYNDTGRAYLQKDFENGRLVAVYDLVKRNDSLAKLSKESSEKDGVESKFPGAANAWANYLGRNLSYPERAIKARMDGMVVVQFIVNTEGLVEDIEIYKSIEFSLDEESIRMLVKSPRWVPAQKNGQKVKSYKRQPIVYRLP